MKKLLNAFLPLILILPFKSIAQTQIVGFRAGFNMSKIYVTNLDTEIPFYNPLPGYHVSGLVKTELKNKLVLQTELGYSVKGLAENNSGKFKQHYHYLTMPVLLNYNLNKNISVAAGLEPSYFLNYKQCTPFAERKWDLCADAGMEFKLSSVFSLGLRYNHGLIPVSTLDVRDIQGRNLKMVRFSNRTLQLSLSSCF